MSTNVSVAVLWVTAFLALSALVCPMLLRSGSTPLTLLAFFAPCLWVLASVVLYIAWADAGWREEWEQPAPPLPVRTAGVCHSTPAPRIC